MGDVSVGRGSGRQRSSTVLDKPIERVVIAAAHLLRRSKLRQRRNVASSSSGPPTGENFFLNANYTFVDSKITLLPEQLGVCRRHPSDHWPVSPRTCSTDRRVGHARFFHAPALQYFGDRISDVGANDAPDIIEEGRGSLDLVFAQRIRGLGIRLTLENLTDTDYRFTQTLSTTEDQRLYRLGRTVALSFGYNVF